MDLISYNQLAITALLSIIGAYSTYLIIPRMKQTFVKANLFGIDLCKANRDKQVPESQGMIAGCLYLVILFLFIPIQFSQINYHHQQHFELFTQFLAGLLSICCMLMLGFADDVLDLRWRTKLFIPMIASLPLLIVYMLTYDNTTIIIPKPLRTFIGFSMNLGLVYYVFFAMLAIFCTNAINIVAGINGIEAGQGFMIASSIITYNLIELSRKTDHWQAHIFSLNMMGPFVGVTLGLLYHNWYPSEVFVGDTYCYFAGMTFAVVGILGHFSKTMLLFFIPQMFNFLYSCPQLFHFIDCPRHRLPKFDSKRNVLTPSTFLIHRKKTGTLGIAMIWILRTFRLVNYRQINLETFECSNLTIINLMMVLFGPKHEKTLTKILLALQLFCTILAFGIRYGLSQIFY